MGKMLKHSLLLVALVCVACTGIANAEWLNYSNPIAANDFGFDADGHVWIPALGAVCDLDPVSGDFEVYTSSSGLPCSCGNGLAIDGDGVVWVAMTKGIGAIHPNGTVERFYAENSALNSDYGKAVGIGLDGLVWVGTDEGVYSYDGTSWTGYLFMGIPSMTVNNAIEVAPDGKVWIGTEGGLRVYDGTDWVIYSEADSGFPLHVRDIAFAPDGKTWFATYSGVASFDGTDWELFDFSNTSVIMNPYIEAVAAAADGTIYAGFPNGVLIYDGTDWALWDTENSDIPSNIINALDIAPDGSLWIGTPAGSAALKTGAWTTYSHSKYPELNGQVQSIAEDGSGVLWLGCLGGGLVAKDGDTLTAYNLSNSSILSNMVESIAIATDGSLWLGTGDGISHFDGSDFVNYSVGLGNFPAAGSVVDMKFAPNGTLWAIVQDMTSPASNICYFSGGQWQVLQLMTLARFTSLAISDDGDIYIGTVDMGMYIWDGATLTQKSQLDGMPGNTVTCMVKSSSGSIWVGTTNGLGVTNGTTWQVYNMQNSMLTTNEIRDVFPADNDTVWVSTGNGLISINSETSVRYSSQYGGLLVDITSSVYKASNGNIVIGGLVGLAELTVESYPSLSNGSVGPDSGLPTTPFTYRVDYKNAEAQTAPEIIVYIDSRTGTMGLSEGDINDGGYIYVDTVDVGMLHTYYFTATDENGARTRYPYDFMLSGPTVSQDPVEVIIETDQALYVDGDQMVVRLTLKNRLDEPLEVLLYTAVEMPTSQLLFFRYPDLFTLDLAGLHFTLNPLQEIDGYTILNVTVTKEILSFGEYAWKAACVDPSAPGLELLSNISVKSWQFAEDMQPPVE
ncbi:MAG: hypothetical protein JW941_05250 [Candidatus Coatesbacteria bacterium]|nr:hypothetical protein [Candidatus Coatesbacteria bacterium]